MFRFHHARRIRHEIGSLGGLRERNHIADVVGAGQQHDEPVQPEGDAAVRGGAVVQGLEVVKVDKDKNLILVRGAVPGPRNSLVEIVLSGS